VVIDEGYRNYGVTGELATAVYEGAFDYLDAPVVRLGAMDVPIPFTKPLEDATIPNEKDVVAAVTAMMK
jgi:pyruvate dehydrogenase E1 component beta subunit